MWRYFAGAGAGVLLIVAGMTLQAMRTKPAQLLAAMPAANAATAQLAGSAEVPEALPKTREEKRFNRFDKDRDGAISRDEYLVSRKKAYTKLDSDGNGALSFDEWAIKAATKFTDADKDKSGTMTAAEFATTAMKRKGKPRPECPTIKSVPDTTKDDDS